VLLMETEFKNFKIGEGYISHWFFGIRAVLIHYMVKNAFGYDDNFLMAGCVMSFGHAVQQKKSKKTTPTQAEQPNVEEDPDFQDEEDEVDDDSRQEGTESESENGIDASKVLHHIIRGAVELVRNVPGLNQLYGDSLRELKDQMQNRHLPVERDE
jgi:hypothetical protein